MKLTLQTINLDGIKGGRRKGRFFSSVAGAFRILKAGGVANASGDNGALIVYRDDAGNYRCNFCRYMRELSAETFHSQTLVRRWLKKWRPKLN